MTKYKIGDKVTIRPDLEKGMPICFGVNKEMAKYAGLTLTIRDIEEREDGDDCYRLVESNWSWHKDMFTESSHYTQTMRTLNTLTDEQKEVLSPENQALLQLNIIRSDLTLYDTDYVLKFLFKQNRAEIGAQAVSEVQKVEAEKAKTQDE